MKPQAEAPDTAGGRQLAYLATLLPPPNPPPTAIAPLRPSLSTNPKHHTPEEPGLEELGDHGSTSVPIKDPSWPPSPPQSLPGNSFDIRSPFALSKSIYLGEARITAIMCTAFVVSLGHLYLYPDLFGVELCPSEDVPADERMIFHHGWSAMLVIALIEVISFCLKVTPPSSHRTQRLLAQDDTPPSYTPPSLEAQRILAQGCSSRLL
ncbi:hypothetical protein CYMTET_10665 [Cymbomonas tetramitiformis]|uniref:Uncharacterized protein n=1 Tax=Cymbomonas tetramitiformis TaxID=36881 RepID=A0AAE0LDS6_9CHLO|nr:hypothetical protein CYMTET_10665 [Cymbomonas tetramitiformis]